MRLLSGMCTGVSMQLPTVLEATTTVRAFVGLLLGVSPSMNAQILFYSKILSTYFARKRALSFKMFINDYKLKQFQL